MNKKTVITILVLLFLFLGGYLLHSKKVDTQEDSDSSRNIGAVLKYSTDIIGTKTGTSTPTGGGFYGNYTASTTDIIKIANSIDLATFSLLVLDASSTPTSNIYMSFYGSNDFNCDTSTTTRNTNDTTNEQVLVSEIDWYDIGDHVAELAGTQSLAVGTSTLSVIGTAGHAKDIILRDLDYDCLKTEVNASSTQLYIQLHTK